MNTAVTPPANGQSTEVAGKWAILRNRSLFYAEINEVSPALIKQLNLSERDIFPSQDAAVAEWLGRLTEYSNDISDEITRWSPKLNKVPLSANQLLHAVTQIPVSILPITATWKPGAQLNNNTEPCLVIWDNGNESVLWEGKTDDSESVVAYFPVPPKPDLGYTPNAGFDDRGNPVGKYFWKRYPTNDASAMT